MKLFGMVLAALVIFALPAKSTDDKPFRVPVMRVVEPAIAKVGQTVVVTGDNLNQPQVGDVFLNDGKDNYKVKILSRTETAMRLEVPAELAPGRYRFVILITEPELTFLEEPVRLLIE